MTAVGELDTCGEVAETGHLEPRVAAESIDDDLVVEHVGVVQQLLVPGGAVRGGVLDEEVPEGVAHGGELGPVSCLYAPVRGGPEVVGLGQGCGACRRVPGVQPLGLEAFNDR